MATTDLSTLLSRIDNIRAMAKERASTASSSSTTPAPTAPASVQLPLWSEAVRAVPNCFLRSALFSASNSSKGFTDSEIIAVDGLSIRYAGPCLDQIDLDVYESVLHAVRAQALGSRCYVTTYALLKLMGKTNSGGNRRLLQERLRRLTGSTLTIRQNGIFYVGSLLHYAAEDEQRKMLAIEIDPRLAALYAPDQYTLIDWQIRQELRGKPLAQWLHGFYSTHADPYPMRVETLLRLAGSQNAHGGSAAQKLRKALDAVAAACAAHGQPFSYEIRDGLVYPVKAKRPIRRKK